MSINILFDLIEKNNFDDFFEITKNILDLSDIYDGYGQTLLHKAVEIDNINFLKYLVSKKCYVIC